MIARNQVKNISNSINNTIRKQKKIISNLEEKSKLNEELEKKLEDNLCLMKQDMKLCEEMISLFNQIESKENDFVSIEYWRAYQSKNILNLNDFNE